MKSTKLSKLEILFLTAMLLCYITSLYFLLSDNKFLLLIFFVLHSCLIMAFLFVSQARYTRSLLDKDASSIQAAEERRLFEQNSSTITQLRNEQDKLLLEKERLSASNAKLVKENEELTRLLTEAEVRPEPAFSCDGYGIIPAVENPVETDIIPIVQNVIDEMLPYSHSHGISLVLSTASSKLKMKADSTYIKVMFQNVIDNSIKYMRRNGSLVITLSNVGDNLFIVLKDNGEGLPANELEHIFELNYQGSNRSTGNGLGLAQVKAIVEHYGGTVYAKSDNGMAIYIQLPAGLN